MSDAPASRVLIIGAGIAGLTAARALTFSGVSAVVIDKGRGVGGRIATRRLSDGQAYDHGALRFTAQDGAVASLASSWEAEGLVVRVPGEGSPCWNIAGPATRLPKRLAGRYARAESPVAELAPTLNPPGAPILLCGDAFGPLPARSPDGGADGIARAVLSGLAAAARLREELRS